MSSVTTGDRGHIVAKKLPIDYLEEEMFVPNPEDQGSESTVMVKLTSYQDGTIRVKFEGYGSARVLKLHLANELDMIVQQSPIEEPGKVY